MLSFVVQNFKSQTPFFLKTRKYKEFLGFFSTTLVLILIKFLTTLLVYQTPLYHITGRLMTLFKSFYVKGFWKKIKSSFNKHLGLYPNTITLSFEYHKYSLLLKGLNHKITKPLFNLSTSDDYVVRYFKPIPILYFSFQKSTYNTLIIYILKILVDTYYSQKINFNLY